MGTRRHRMLSMKIKPLGWRVLVKPVTLEEDAALPEFLKNSKFLIKAGMDANEDRRAKVAMEQGVVVALGSTAFKDKMWGWTQAKEDSGEWVVPDRKSTR